MLTDLVSVLPGFPVKCPGELGGGDACGWVVPDWVGVGVLPGKLRLYYWESAQGNVLGDFCSKSSLYEIYDKILTPCFDSLAIRHCP